jgi:hypothetical protein
MFQPPPPKPSPKAVAKANSLLVLKFYSNLANKKFKETIKHSLVFHDDLNLGLTFIQTYIQHMYPFLGWQWVARVLPNKKFMIEPPDVDWRAMILSKGELILGEV